METTALVERPGMGSAIVFGRDHAPVAGDAPPSRETILRTAAWRAGALGASPVGSRDAGVSLDRTGAARDVAILGDATLRVAVATAVLECTALG